MSPAYRLYRTAGDGARVTFTTSRDRQIPLVDGVTVMCSTRPEVDAVLAAATEGGLVAKLHHPTHQTPASRFAVVIRDGAQEAA